MLGKRKVAPCKTHSKQCHYSMFTSLVQTGACLSHCKKLSVHSFIIYEIRLFSLSSWEREVSGEREVATFSDESFGELGSVCFVNVGGERGPGLDSESESGVDSESERESCSQGLAGGGGKILDLPSTRCQFCCLEQKETLANAFNIIKGLLGQAFWWVKC